MCKVGAADIRTILNWAKLLKISTNFFMSLFLKRKWNRSNLNRTTCMAEVFGWQFLLVFTLKFYSWNSLNPSFSLNAVCACGILKFKWLPAWDTWPPTSGVFGMLSRGRSYVGIDSYGFPCKPTTGLIELHVRGWSYEVSDSLKPLASYCTSERIGIHSRNCQIFTPDHPSLCQKECIVV